MRIGQRWPGDEASNSYFISLQSLTVIPITSYVEKVYPFEVLLPAVENGLSKNSKAKCNQIRTIDKQRLIKVIGKLRHEIMEEVEEATKIHLKMK